MFLKNENLLDDSTSIALNLNDYISNVFPNLFPTSPTFIFPLTTADYLIQYVTEYVTEPNNYLGCAKTNNTLDIAEIFSESVVKMHPLYIEINSKEPVFSTEIYRSINSNKIDIQFLTKGIYLFKLSSENRSQFKIQKFIK
jgi:5'-nucleotidase/UDP-sugar diphosphatase